MKKLIIPSLFLMSLMIGCSVTPESNNQPHDDSQDEPAQDEQKDETQTLRRFRLEDRTYERHMLD